MFRLVRSFNYLAWAFHHSFLFLVRVDKRIKGRFKKPFILIKCIVHKSNFINTGKLHQSENVFNFLRFKMFKQFHASTQYDDDNCIVPLMFEFLCFKKRPLFICHLTTSAPTLSFLLPIKQLLFQNKMRSLQTKQPPTAIRFTYQDSPARPLQSQIQYRSQSVTKAFESQFQPPPPPPTRKTLAFDSQASHIKVVEMSQSEERKERRHKIFEEVGEIARQSKSRERNRSYSIFNGVNNENTSNIKDLVMSKESCKERSVQTDGEAKEEQKISTFMKSAQKTTPILPMKQLRIQLPNSREGPLELSKYTHTTPYQADSLQKQLTLKEKELSYLRLQLQRHERCERITHENESIYKRLVEKLDTITHRNTVSNLHKHHTQSQRQSKSKKSPQKKTLRNGSPSETTRFMHPQSSRKQSKQKQVLTNVLNQMTPSSDVPQEKALNNEFQRSNTATFCRLDHKKTIKNNRAALHAHVYLQPPPYDDEQLRQRLEQSVRRYTNAVTFQDVPIKDKLSSINRHLENKYTIREQMSHTQQPYHTRMSSQSRIVQRGRAITTSSAVNRNYLYL